MDPVAGRVDDLRDRSTRCDLECVLRAAACHVDVARTVYRNIAPAKEPVHPIAGRVDDLRDHSTRRDLEGVVGSNSRNVGVACAVHGDIRGIAQAVDAIARRIDDLCDYSSRSDLYDGFSVPFKNEEVAVSGDQELGAGGLHAFQDRIVLRIARTPEPRRARVDLAIGDERKELLDGHLIERELVAGEDSAGLFENEGGEVEL
jgi:hypothetical protein